MPIFERCSLTAADLRDGKLRVSVNLKQRMLFFVRKSKWENRNGSYVAYFHCITCPGCAANKPGAYCRSRLVCDLISTEPLSPFSAPSPEGSIRRGSSRHLSAHTCIARQHPTIVQQTSRLIRSQVSPSTPRYQSKFFCTAGSVFFGLRFHSTSPGVMQSITGQTLRQRWQPTQSSLSTGRRFFASQSIAWWAPS